MAPSGSEPTYTLGDSALAGDRLALLAEVFDPTTADFITATAPAQPSVAVDIGCGPGFTTRLIADITRATRTIGLDASPVFVERARIQQPDLEFLEHDVTRVPFPVGPADVIFARYLLTHLPDAATAVTAWATQLATGGRVLVEDVEAIDTDLPVFAEYLEISGSMLRQHGGSPYVGKALAEFAPRDGDVVLVDARQAAIAPATSVVARLFRMNLATWRHNPWVVDNVDEARIEQLDTDLAPLYDSDGTGEIRWTHRQVAYERT
jgi:SAM-dependent methyltransferase